MCLVGDQSEYGADDGYQKAAALAEQVAAVHRAVQVQTLLDEHRPIPASVEIDLQCATTMITTRMHGSLLAIFHGVPVIALDQINHGAKVTRMVSQLDWPVYNAWTTDAEAIARQLEQFRNNHPEKLLDHARGRLVKLSRQSLERAVECIMVELKSA